MNYNYVWMFFVILRCVPVSPRATHGLRDSSRELIQQHENSAQNVPENEDISILPNDKVISVRITSSVAVARRNGKPARSRAFIAEEPVGSTSFTEFNSTESTILSQNYNKEATDIPSNLIGANMEFIKQLNAKKDKQNVFTSIQAGAFQEEESKESDSYTPETKPVYEVDSNRELKIESDDIESLPTYHNLNEDDLYNKNINYTDSIAEPSLKSVQRYELEGRDDEESIPQARSMPPSYHGNQYPKNEKLFQDADIEGHKRNESDILREPSVESHPEVTDKDAGHDIPLGRSIPVSPSPDNYISSLINKPVSERGNNERLTTVSFNVVHDTPKQVNNYNLAPITNINPSADISPKFYEPPKIYSQPAKVYSEPAKFYSEPAKVYSEPAKVYSEPAKIYSEPAKIYSEPAKFYSPPASLHLPPVPPDYRPWQQLSPSPDVTSTSNTTPISTGTHADVPSSKRIHEHQPEKNYEVDEKISVLSEGRIHGVQESSTEKCKQDNCKVGYVVEGRQYKKYRVEERTSDGFIVGEYGVVRNEDGALRGVRYTADSDASPRLIYDALMKFLQLK